MVALAPWLQCRPPSSAVPVCQPPVKRAGKLRDHLPLPEARQGKRLSCRSAGILPARSPEIGKQAKMPMFCALA